MNSEFAIGDRVRHPSLTKWGVGQIIAIDIPILTVHFEGAGEKKIRTDIVNLRPVDGTEAESSILDAKFKNKRARRSRRLDDPRLFNCGKSTSRKQFIESLGASCANWTWSWSFVNHEQKKVIFGAWQDQIHGNRARIFGNEWRSRRGRNQSAWPESRENIRLVEENGYSLHVFTIIPDPDFTSPEKGPRKIQAFLKDVTEGELIREGDDWYAVFAADRK